MPSAIAENRIDSDCVFLGWGVARSGSAQTSCHRVLVAKLARSLPADCLGPPVQRCIVYLDLDQAADGLSGCCKLRVTTKPGIRNNLISRVAHLAYMHTRGAHTEVKVPGNLGRCLLAEEHFSVAGLAAVNEGSLRKNE